jgi:hypothetical protein
MAHHLLATQIRAQTAAFERGLSRLINVRLLRMFARHELQLLISGADGTIDVDDCRRTRCCAATVRGTTRSCVVLRGGARD